MLMSVWHACLILDSIPLFGLHWQLILTPKYFNEVTYSIVFHVACECAFIVDLENTSIMVLEMFRCKPNVSLHDRFTKKKIRYFFIIVRIKIRCNVINSILKDRVKFYGFTELKELKVTLPFIKQFL